MSDQRTVTLRIKKEFLDQIRSRRKRVEIRAYSPFYRKVFKDGKPDLIKFHYQDIKDQLIIKCDDLLVLPTDKVMKKTALKYGIKLGKKHYAIFLGKIVNKGKKK